jgi:hypothetical protein
MNGHGYELLEAAFRSFDCCDLFLAAALEAFLAISKRRAGVRFFARV